MKHALVTGGFGFIGRHVCKKLSQRGFVVTSIGHGAWARDEFQSWGISEWKSADITQEALATYGGLPDVLVHCAGSASVPFSMTHPNIDFVRTVESTAAVLEYMHRNRPNGRVVLLSTAGVYGATSAGAITTKSALHPISPYGVHKKIAEELCESYGRHFGLTFAIVRLFSVYGPGLRRQLLWDACNKIAQGDYTFMGGGVESRDWIHVDDASNLISMLAELNDKNVILNGGTGEGVTVKAVVEEIANCWGAPAPHFSGQVRAGDPMHYLADITEAQDLGWKPQHHWKAGVLEYVNWVRAGAQ